MTIYEAKNSQECIQGDMVKESGNITLTENKMETNNENMIVMEKTCPMWKSNSIIKEGDLVILYQNFKTISHIYIKSKEIYQNRLGAFHHDDMIGKPFGTKIYARVTKRWMYMLSPTPELWSEALPHRTQIVFTLDASLILFHLNIQSGHKVVESGTGSGSLSSSFARALAPYGHLFTFEFNETRARLAQEEFERNGLKDIISVKWKDVCEEGFGDELKDKMDAVFLDLPCPWKAVEHAKKVLKKNGSFCSYSPCIEQVQKTCDALRSNGFEMVRTLETRLIPHEHRHMEIPIPVFGSPLKMPKDDKEEKDKEHKKRKQEEIENEKKINDNNNNNNEEDKDKKVYVKKEMEIRGHTAFLTFARKF